MPLLSILPPTNSPPHLHHRRSLPHTHQPCIRLQLGHRNVPLAAPTTPAIGPLRLTSSLLFQLPPHVALYQYTFLGHGVLIISMVLRHPSFLGSSSHGVPHYTELDHGMLVHWQTAKITDCKRRPITDGGWVQIKPATLLQLLGFTLLRWQGVFHVVTEAK